MDKEALKEKGHIAFHEMIDDAGGALAADEVADLLGISPGAVKKRYERGCLLAVPYGEGLSFPVWQFGESDVIQNFAETMSMLNTNSPVGVVRFFLTEDVLIDTTPIDALKSGDEDLIAKTKMLADQFNQQVAR